MSPEPGCGLLHNMSAPPKTTVAYTGLAGFVKATGCELPRPRPKRRGPEPWAALQFYLPKGFPTDVPAILAALGADAGVDPEATLELLVEERARQLPLPDGCLVLPANAVDRTIRPDPLTTIAIIAKCSDFVWLRQKSPSLARLERVSAVALLIPAAAAQSLQETLP